MARFLDNIGLAYFWEKIKAWIPFLSRKTQSIPFGQVDSTSTSTVFTATVDGITELRDGVCCYLRNGVVSSASGCTLNINNLGAFPIYNTWDGSRSSTAFSSSRTYLFVYNSSRVDGGCWDLYAGYYSDSDVTGYNVRQYYHGKKPKTILYRYQFLFTCMDGLLLPVNTVNRSVATNKELTTESFDVFGEVYYYGTTTIIQPNASIGTGNLWSQAAYTLCDLRYSFNTGETLVAGNDVYLVCSPQPDGSVKLAKDPIAFALPNTEDGLLYKRLGKCYDTYRIVLEQHKPVYYYKDGAIRIWANQAVQDVSNKADKVVGATSGNFAGLDATGNLTDSGCKPSDFLTQHQHLPEYTIEKLTQAETSYSASYVLKKDNVQVGATINIPKDMVVSSGEVKTVTTANVPYQGAQVGDKYIDLTIANTSQNHIYIPVKDLVDVYVAGNGIRISDNNYISIVVDSNNANGLGVGGSGLALYHVTPSVNGSGGSDGAMLATDKEKLDGIEAGAEENVIETVKVSGTALQVTDKAVNIVTETAYDPTTNKIATMSDVTGATPNVGHLKTDNSASLTPSASESFTSDISLHKVSKTGSYNDLNDKPTIPDDSNLVHKTGNETISDRKLFYLYGDNYHTYNVCDFGVTSSFKHVVMYTNIPFPVAVMPVVTIKGFMYSSSDIESKITFYMYNGEFYQPRVQNLGAYNPTVYLFAYDDNGTNRVAIGLEGVFYFMGFQADIHFPALGASYRPSTQWATAYDNVTYTEETIETDRIIPSVGVNHCVKVTKNKLADVPSLPLSIANGGTGKTTAEAAANALIGGLPTWTADPSDDVYLIRRDTSGSLAFGQVKFSTVWNYIKSKIASVLGIGGSNGVPTAPTAAAGTNTTQIATTAFVNNATSGFAIDDDVVHKAGSETITGEKTFEANVNLTEGATLNLIYDSQTQDGVYLQATELNGLKTVSFSGISDDGMVQIKNVYVPTNDTDAANKYYVDEEILDIDEYRVYLACRFGPYGVHQKSLCAFCLTNGGREMMMTSFTKKSGTAAKEVITDLVFPIGCKIYYNDGTYDSLPNTSAMVNRYYTSFNGVDVRYSAITGTSISLGNYPSETQSTVYLHVIVEDGYWKPYYKEGATNEIIVDSFHMQSGNFYIYLGKTVRNTGYTIQLEDNNPLYYYDGTKLIDWASYLKTVIELESSQDMSTKADKVSEATSGNLAGLDYSGNLTDSGLAADEVATLGTNQLTNYYKKTEIYSKSETDELIRAASDFEYVEVSTLPTASASTKGKFYLYNGHRYVTTEVTSGVFSWIDLGSYDIDLSNYVTNSDFDAELATRPTYERLDSEAQMQSMINNHTWVEGVIYYTVEED